MGFSVVGIFPLFIGVMHDSDEPWARAGGGPFQHLLVAIGVAEGKDRAAAYEAIDSDRLARPVIDELDLCLLHEDGLTITCRLEFGHARRADDLLRWNSVDLVCPGTHELDAAAGDNVGLETIRPEILQELDHRLVNKLDIRSIEAFVLGGRD